MIASHAYGRIAVVMGGHSAERDVSLDSGAAVLQALLDAGVDAHRFDPGQRPLAELIAGEFDGVFNILHGPGGENGELQGFLEWHGMPYTGSGVLASALTMDKAQTKRILRSTDIATPEWEIANSAGDMRAIARTLGLPLVVKPVAQGSSVGMTMVARVDQLDAAFDLAAGTGDAVMCEAFVDGPEHTVTILGGKALPSILIETPRVFYDYEAKYEDDKTRFTCPGLDTEDESRYQAIALAAFDACGLGAWGRVDFLTDAATGAAYVIELNTVPGMTSHSLVPLAASEVGLDFPALCVAILEASGMVGQKQKAEARCGS